MPIVPMTLRLPVPSWIHGPLRSVKRAMLPAPTATIDLSGDRDIEWSYIASRLPAGTGRVLDFGCGYGNMSIHAIQKGYSVLALDLEQIGFPWSHPKLERLQGDLLSLDLPVAEFDFVLNCSTVEHVGLTGRYGVDQAQTDGDLAAMQKMQKLLKASGKMLMTVPCGHDAVIGSWHRVYGRERLPRLLSGFEVEESCYWVKQTDNRWYPASEEAALAYVPTQHPSVAVKCSYALGCFVLKPDERLRGSIE